MEFDNLADLHVLVATSETGSLTAAGRRCGMSTAAVSAALKRLEKTLGARMFERTTRLVRPTPEGDLMIDHARRALDLVAEGRLADIPGVGATLQEKITTLVQTGKLPYHEDLRKATPPGLLEMLRLQGRASFMKWYKCANSGVIIPAARFTLLSITR